MGFQSMNRRNFIPGFISAVVLSVVGSVAALAQRTYREYIIPEIETENDSLKKFEKAVREHINDLSRRLEDRGR